VAHHGVKDEQAKGQEDVDDKAKDHQILMASALAPSSPPPGHAADSSLTAATGKAAAARGKKGTFFFLPTRDTGPGTPAST